MVSFGTNRVGSPVPVKMEENCRLTEAAGFSHFWFQDSQLRRGDPFVNLLVASRVTERVTVGTLLVNPVTRHPTVLAASIAAVDMYAPGRVIMGIGAGDTAVHQIGLRPARLAQTERAIRVIRSLLAGEDVDLGWTEPSRLEYPRPVPVIVAGSGPKTLRMAGRIADGVVIRIGTDPELVQWGYDEFRAGALEAGRHPEDLFVAGHFHTVLADDPDLVTARAKVMAAGYYEVNPATWERLGIPWTLPPVHDLLKSVRPDFHHAYDMDLAARLVAEMPEAHARRFCLAGNGPEVRQQIEALVARFPWMRHIILQPNMPGRDFIQSCATDIIPWF